MNPHAPTPPDGRFCILLIEEDEAVAKVVQTALAGAGQDVEWVANSEEGLARFKAKNHHLVLLDLQLTGVSGRELCCEIRDISAVPVIIITALNGSEDQLLGFKVGADDYVIKPLEPRHLVLRVVALLRRVYRYDRLPAKATPPDATPLTTRTLSGSSGAMAGTPSTPSLRDALQSQGIAEVPTHDAGSGLPSGWGGCDSCGYMGPHFKFEPEERTPDSSIGCPVCGSNRVIFSID